MTHRDLCRTVARWMLESKRWCDLVTYEVAVAGGIADVLACSDPRRVAVCEEHARLSAQEAARVREAYRTLLMDRDRTLRDGLTARPRDLILAAVEGTPRTVPPVLARRRGEPLPRVGMVEVKRTRADLLADLRAKKMLRYQASATHCWLALTTPALCPAAARPPWTGRGASRRRALDQLTELGLPKSWGVLWVDGGAVSSLRSARPLQPATPALLYGTGWAIARSLTNRVVRRGTL